MDAESQALRSDDELLRITSSVLSQQGFDVEAVTGDVDLVLAENRYFVVAVGAMNTIQELILAESVVFDALAQRIDSAVLGPKKWDTYMVLLTRDKSVGDDGTRDLYRINYDTSQLRRIAHTGVDATSEAVSHALAPFFDPDTAKSSAAHADALDSLLKTLILRGADEKLAQRAISAFEQGAALDDVL